MAFPEKSSKPKHRVIDVCGLAGRRLLVDRVYSALADQFDPSDALTISDVRDGVDMGVQLRKALVEKRGMEPEFVGAHVRHCDLDAPLKKNFMGQEILPTLDSRRYALGYASLLNSPESEVRTLIVDGGEEYLGLLLENVRNVGLTVYVVALFDERDGLFPREADAESWRDQCKSFGQLSAEQPKYLLEKLVPEKALTLIPAASYNCKTWFTVAMCDAISRGRDLWCFKGPSAPAPVIYHVPEMNESLVRHYMATVGVEDSDNFLVRPMESGLWALDDARMLESAGGRVVVLDTAGYFNPADDSSSYQQSLRFASLVYNLMVAGGALAVIGLYHPPKYSKEEATWTLENSVLGSAGYGGILRSCLRMANLNPDLNDPNVHVYVQGLKNPGLKPFQLCGPMPLKMKVPPGESPYLSALRSGDAKYAEAAAMFEQDVPQRKVAEQLDLSLGKVNKMHKDWKASKDF